MLSNPTYDPPPELNTAMQLQERRRLGLEELEPTPPATKKARVAQPVSSNAELRIAADAGVICHHCGQKGHTAGSPDAAVWCKASPEEKAQSRFARLAHYYQVHGKAPPPEMGIPTPNNP